MYYYGVKLHIIGSSQYGTIPVPELMSLMSAVTSDIKAYEQVLPDKI